MINNSVIILLIPDAKRLPGIIASSLITFLHRKPERFEKEEKIQVASGKLGELRVFPGDKTKIFFHVRCNPVAFRAEKNAAGKEPVLRRIEGEKAFTLSLRRVRLHSDCCFQSKSSSAFLQSPVELLQGSDGDFHDFSVVG